MRERSRVATERASAAARMEDARRSIAAVLPGPEAAVEEALEGAERRLADVLGDADRLRQAGRAGEERAAVQRAAHQRIAADADRAMRRATEASRRLQAQEDLAVAAREAADQAAQRATVAAAAREAAHAAEQAAEQEAAEARMAAGEATASAATAAEAHSRLRAEQEGLAARREALEQQLRDGTDERVVRSLRARGGRRFSDGLEVEPDFRLAVEAALGDVLAGLVLDVQDARSLAEAAAVLVLRDDGDARERGDRAAERAAARLEEAVFAAGGGWLAGALRLDPEGHAARLLARCAWVPDLEAALAVRTHLPVGWRLVTRAGVVIDDLAVVRPAPGVSTLERRAALEEMTRRLTRVAADLEAASISVAATAAARSAADARVVAARDTLDAARRARRLADETDRSAASGAENAARERAWQEALLGRAQAEAAAAAEESTLRGAELQALDEARTGERPDATDSAALAALEARAALLRAERDRLAHSAGEARAARDRALEARRRAEIGLGLAEARLEELDRDEMTLSGREADLAAQRERSSAALASAQAGQREAAAAFDESVASARAEREALLAAEAASGFAREQLRLAEQRSRASEVAEMEARLQMDAAREGLLVELASIGPDGLTALLDQLGRPAPEAPPQADELPELLEGALELALEHWRLVVSESDPTDEPPTEPPSRARIAALRRRFNEVGAGNPFAAQELAEVKGRLDSLELQRDDLERAIRDTREMMIRLDELMTVQFRDTFGALEDAFARRFQQLFGGGEAQLSLTDPSDLATTGVEIDRPAAGQAPPAAGDALRWGAGAHCRGTPDGHAGGAPGPLLRPRRGGRCARRGQYRPLLDGPAVARGDHPVRGHHPQPWHHRGRRRALRRDRGGGCRESRHLAAAGGRFGRGPGTRASARMNESQGGAAATRILLQDALRPSRLGFAERVRNLLGAGQPDDETWEEVEEALISADLGAELAIEVCDRARARRDVPPQKALQLELLHLFATREPRPWPRIPGPGIPAVILVVGVNGTGKTTSIAKLAYRFKSLGARVLLAAADTFRAAAIEQLTTWAQRIDVPVIAHAAGADPSAVVFDAVDAAKARAMDVLIIDTAGRLHTKSNLMDELAKIRRTITKRLPEAQPEVLFVLDATTGQNGLLQARAFHESSGLTAIALTKLDSTSKGGVAFAIERQTSVPVLFVGLGEKVGDLRDFDPNAFVAALFAVD